MTIHEASQQLIFQLFDIYEERESRNIADLVMEKITEWKRIDRVVNKEVPLSPDKQQLLFRYTEELLSQKPVQYVLSEAWFCGMKLYVNESVLIPRPETEELVDWIMKDLGALPGENVKRGEEHVTVGENAGDGALAGENASYRHEQAATDMTILDMGTGSGCIAITLKKKLPGAVVFACDVSGKALDVACVNAAVHETDIFPVLCDFLKEEERKNLPVIDILVSNPPYIPHTEKSSLPANVMQYEPGLALFVPDEDQHIFYNAMADFARTHLSRTGSVYVEIHEQSGNAVTRLFTAKGFGNIQLKKDLQGRDRMIRAGW